MWVRLGRHVRSNAVGYVALFFALSGSAAAFSNVLVGNSELQTGAVNSRVVKDHSLRSTDLAKHSVRGSAIKLGTITGANVANNSLTGKQIDESTLDPNILQSRVIGSCAGNTAVQRVAEDGSLTCSPFVTSVTAGSGLLGGTINHAGILSIDPAFRLPQSCADGQVAKWSNGTGSWVCASDATGVGSGGTVTSVDSGTGLDGGPITHSGTLSIDPAFRLPQSCTSGQVAKSDGAGSWTCAADNNSGGTVTSVGSGFGLTGGPITTSGSLAVDSTQVQSRVSGSCSGTQAIQSVNQNGTVSCSGSLQTAGHILAPTATVLNDGTTGVLFSTNGIQLAIQCTDVSSQTTPVVTIGPTGDTTTISMSAQSAVSGFEHGSATTPLTISQPTNSSVLDRVEFDALANDGTAAGGTLGGSFEDYASAVGTGKQCVFEGFAVAS